MRPSQAILNNKSDTMTKFMFVSKYTLEPGIVACAFNLTYQSEGRERADLSEFSASLICILSKFQASQCCIVRVSHILLPPKGCDYI